MVRIRWRVFLRHWYLPGLTAAVILVLVPRVGAADRTGSFRVAADHPLPTENQGPRFGALGPGRPMPAPEGPAPGATVPAPAPGAPPAMPAPAPNIWGGCYYDLRGNWRLTGFETAPSAYPYTGELHIRQYGSWLQITQDGGALSYYGQCIGDSIELDAYQGAQFIGYENGHVGWGGRWGGLRVQLEWVTWTPDYATGHETWQRLFVGP
ncbi:MAG TPA: hypothetical protein VFB73_04350 [Chloroflexota bacterium]|nr:hypothetical protein [Chloroflexota bacterium]